MQKRVLVTGGASGLGKAIALRWAKQGSNICIADIHDERAEETVKELTELGVEAFYERCDITNEDDIEKVKQALVEKWQGVDLVVNNAGIASADSLADEDMDQWHQILEVNLLGAVKMTRAFAPVMEKNENKSDEQKGYFLNVASQAGITPIPMMTSYNVSKAALVTFSETMRLELHDAGIGVSVLCPGFFKTNLKESLRTKSEGLKIVLDKMMERATMTAEDVAEAAIQGVDRNDFIILSHKEGRSMFRLKRWLPNFYLKKMAEHTARIRSKN